MMAIGCISMVRWLGDRLAQGMSRHQLHLRFIEKFCQQSETC